MIPAQEALQRLRDGNRRFVEDARNHQGNIGTERRDELVSGQTPFAVILGCSDSRVPAELVFDQGLGDLFVIRVAGNIVAPSQIGSVEFAVDKFGVRLVVVLGHSSCGAVQAALASVSAAAVDDGSSVPFIVNRIRPALEPLVAEGLAPEELGERAVRANVQASVNQLRAESSLLDERLRSGDLRIVGAEYALETGEVDFFTTADATG